MFRFLSDVFDVLATFSDALRDTDRAFIKGLRARVKKEKRCNDLLIEEIIGRDYFLTFIDARAHKISYYENGEPMNIGTEKPMCPYCGKLLINVVYCEDCNKYIETRRVFTTVGDREGDK